MTAEQNETTNKRLMYGIMIGFPRGDSKEQIKQTAAHCWANGLARLNEMIDSVPDGFDGRIDCILSLAPSDAPPLLVNYGIDPEASTQ